MDNLCLEKRGLIEQIVALHIISGHFDAYHVLPLAEVGCDVIRVDAVIVVCCHAGSVRHKLAIDREAIVCRCGQAYEGPRRLLSDVKYMAEGQIQVLFRLASLGPYRDGPLKI